MVGVAGVICVVRRFRWIDRHATDGVAKLGLAGRAR